MTAWVSVRLGDLSRVLLALAVVAAVGAWDRLRGRKP